MNTDSETLLVCEENCIEAKEMKKCDHEIKLISCFCSNKKRFLRCVKCFTIFHSESCAKSVSPERNFGEVSLDPTEKGRNLYISKTKTPNKQRNEESKPNFANRTGYIANRPMKCAQCLPGLLGAAPNANLPFYPISSFYPGIDRFQYPVPLLSIQVTKPVSSLLENQQNWNMFPQKNNGHSMQYENMNPSSRPGISRYNHRQNYAQSRAPVPEVSKVKVDKIQPIPTVQGKQAISGGRLPYSSKTYFRVQIIYANLQTEFYVQTKESAERKTKIEEGLNEPNLVSYFEEVKSFDGWEPVYAMLCEKDNIYVRVSALESVEVANILHVAIQKADHGEKMFVPVGNLRKIPDCWIKQEPSCIFKCSLPITFANDIRGRTPTDFNKMTENLEDLYGRDVTIRVYNRDKSGTHIVDVFVDKGRLEETSSYFLNKNNLCYPIN